MERRSSSVAHPSAPTGDLIDGSTAYMDRIVMPLYIPDFSHAAAAAGPVDNVLNEARIARLRNQLSLTEETAIATEELAALHLVAFRQAAIEYFAAPTLPAGEILLDLALRAASELAVCGPAFFRVNWMAAVGTQRIEMTASVVSRVVLYYNAVSIAMTLGYMTARTTLKINRREPGSPCWFSTAMNVMHYVFLGGKGTEGLVHRYQMLHSVVIELQAARLLPDSFVWRALYDAAYISHAFEKRCIREGLLIEEGPDNPLVAACTWLAERVGTAQENSFDVQKYERIQQLMPRLHSLHRIASRWIANVIKHMPGAAAVATAAAAAATATVDPEESSAAMQDDADEYAIMGLSPAAAAAAASAAATTTATTTASPMHPPGEVFGYLLHCFNWLVRLTFCTELALGGLGIFTHLLIISDPARYRQAGSDTTYVASRVYYTAYIQTATSNVLYPYFSGQTAVPESLMCIDEDITYDGPYVIPPIFNTAVPRFFIWGARLGYTTLHDRLIKSLIALAQCCERHAACLVDSLSSHDVLKANNERMDEYVRGVMLLERGSVKVETSGIGDQLIRLPVPPLHDAYSQQQQQQQHRQQEQEQ